MTAGRKHGLPLRVEARVWRDGKTVTYRYLSPTGEKVYLGTDLAQALTAYKAVTHAHLRSMPSRKVSASLDQQQAARTGPNPKRTRFLARATINSVVE